MCPRPLLSPRTPDGKWRKRKRGVSAVLGNGVLPPTPVLRSLRLSYWKTLGGLSVATMTKTTIMTNFALAAIVLLVAVLMDHVQGGALPVEKSKLKWVVLTERPSCVLKTNTIMRCSQTFYKCKMQNLLILNAAKLTLMTLNLLRYVS